MVSFFLFSFFFYCHRVVLGRRLKNERVSCGNDGDASAAAVATSMNGRVSSAAIVFVVLVVVVVVVVFVGRFRGRVFLFVECYSIAVVAESHAAGNFFFFSFLFFSFLFFFRSSHSARRSSGR